MREISRPSVGRRRPRGGEMADLAYIGLTILVFVLLALAVRGVERL